MGCRARAGTGVCLGEARQVEVGPCGGQRLIVEAAGVQVMPGPGSMASSGWYEPCVVVHPRATVPPWRCPRGAGSEDFVAYEPAGPGTELPPARDALERPRITWGRGIAMLLLWHGTSASEHDRR